MQSSLRNRAAERRQRSSPRATFPLGETDAANAFGMCVPRSFTCVVWGDTRSITNRVACLRTNARARVAVAASRLWLATTIQPWGLRPMLCAVAASRLIRLVRQIHRPTLVTSRPDCWRGDHSQHLSRSANLQRSCPRSDASARSRNPQFTAGDASASERLAR
jgi:hypothetical protein